MFQGKVVWNSRGFMLGFHQAMLLHVLINERTVVNGNRRPKSMAVSIEMPDPFLNHQGVGGSVSFVKAFAIIEQLGGDKEDIDHLAKLAIDMGWGDDQALQMRNMKQLDIFGGNK